MAKFQGKHKHGGGAGKGFKGPGGAKEGPKGAAGAKKKKAKPRSFKNQIRGVERLLKKVGGASQVASGAGLACHEAVFMCWLCSACIHCATGHLQGITRRL